MKDSSKDDSCSILVQTRHIAVGQEWKSREEVTEIEEKSRKIWENLDNEKRASILILMRDAMERLIEDPHVWVPTSMIARSGNRLDIFISINLAEVDEEVLRRRLETERLVADTSTDLRVLKGELKSEDS